MQADLCSIDFELGGSAASTAGELRSCSFLEQWAAAGSAKSPRTFEMFEPRQLLHDLVATAIAQQVQQPLESVQSAVLDQMVDEAKQISLSLLRDEEELQMKR